MEKRVINKINLQRIIFFVFIIIFLILSLQTTSAIIKQLINSNNITPRDNLLFAPSLDFDYPGGTIIRTSALNKKFASEVERLPVHKIITPAVGNNLANNIITPPIIKGVGNNNVINYSTLNIVSPIQGIRSFEEYERESFRKAMSKRIITLSSTNNSLIVKINKFGVPQNSI